MDTIEVNSFTKYGKRYISLPIFDRLLHENKLFAVTDDNGTKWYFKLNKK
jgi:hypothetical protein